MRFTVGQMARICGVTAQALRHYDRIGLIKPRYIDVDNQYRYYAFDQIDSVYTIKYMKYLGMSLKDIKAFFADRTPESIVELMKEQLQITEGRIEELLRIQALLHNKIGKLQSLVNAHHPSGWQVVEMPQRLVVSIELGDAGISDTDAVNARLLELEQSLSVRPPFFIGDIAVSVSRQNLESGVFTRFSKAFIMLNEPLSEAQVLPAGTYANAFHYGSYEYTYKTYESLLKAIRETGYTITGGSLEITWIDSWVCEDEERFVAEIQIPVRRSE